MKLLRINTTVNTGSTGRIAEDIGQLFLTKGHKSYIAYSRKGQSSTSQLIHIGSKLDMYLHGIHTRLFDRHGFASKKATKDLISEIDDLQPDIIGLHNMHGYYLHVGELFRYLKENQHIPVVWTLHDCWPFTGHCIYFEYEGCEKWKTHCKNCPLTHTYPKSFIDNSYKNFEDKRRIFTNHQNLTIVTPSRWLSGLVEDSFLHNYETKVIHNGIDLRQFRILNKKDVGVSEKKIVLGVASVWDERKGLNDFISLSKIFPEEYQIVLVGINKSQKQKLPQNIKVITHTENIPELVKWYNAADVFVNPTYEDNFPTTNIEALACGTPVVTYETGGSPEIIDENTGIVVAKGNLGKLKHAIVNVVEKSDMETTNLCRRRAEENFNMKNRFLDYYNLYQDILKRDSSFVR